MSEQGLASFPHDTQSLFPAVASTG